MARQERGALADLRAMEEESERTNPLNPKSQIGAERGYTGILKGEGATPSMGLSTKRGGGRRKKVEEAVVEVEGGAMGKALGEHLLGLKGRGFFDEFSKGMMGVVSPIVGGGYLDRMVGGSETGAYEGEGTKKGMMRKTSRRAYLKGGAYTTRTTAQGSIVVEMDGRPIGEFASMTDAREFVKNHREKTATRRASITSAETGAFRAPAATITPSERMTTPTDQPTKKEMPPPPRKKEMPPLSRKNKGKGKLRGDDEEITDEEHGGGQLVITHGGAKRTNKRAEVVKRVMREKGMSMIEASKYVKAHGLY